MGDKKILGLREYLELLLREAERRADIQRALLLRSLEERDSQLERRLNTLNELRSEVLTDRALFTPKVAFDTVASRLEHFLTREYYEEQHKGLSEKVDVNVAALAELRREISNLRSRNAGYAAALALAITVFSVILVILQFIRH